MISAQSERPRGRLPAQKLWISTDTVGNIRDAERYRNIASLTDVAAGLTLMERVPDKQILVIGSRDTKFKDYFGYPTGVGKMSEGFYIFSDGFFRQSNDMRVENNKWYKRVYFTRSALEAIGMGQTLLAVVVFHEAGLRVDCCVLGPGARVVLSDGVNTQETPVPARLG